MKTTMRRVKNKGKERGRICTAFPDVITIITNVKDIKYMNVHMITWNGNCYQNIMSLSHMSEEIHFPEQQYTVQKQREYAVIFLKNSFVHTENATLLIHALKRCNLATKGKKLQSCI